jgi:hypothetical protein
MVISIIDKENKLSININPSAVDDAEGLANLTQQLREELLELDVDKVDLISRDRVPKGSKSALGDAIPGELLVTIGTHVAIELFKHICLHIQSWLSRNERGHDNQKRSVTLDFEGDKIKVKASDDPGRQRQIDEWINRQVNKIKR